MTPVLAGIAVGTLSAQDPEHKLGSVAAAHEVRGIATARCMASQLIGCAITNSKKESLGEIEDIVLDSGNRRIAYAVVSFGGFLGMGEKYFALPWRLIEVSQRGSEDTPTAMLGLDQATLKAAPGFAKNSWPDMANADWASRVDEYYSSRKENARPDGAEEPKGSGVAGKRGVDRAPDSAVFVHRRLSKLIGMDVVDVERRKLASVEDLVVDTRLGTVDGALLSFGGTLGFGEKLALAASESLTLDSTANVLVFPCSSAELETMALPGGKLPALNEDDWRSSCLAMCEKAREASANADGDVIPVDASGTKPVPFVDSYDAKSSQTVKGTITTMGVVRIGDQQEERIRLRVHTADGRHVIVYGAPVTFEDQRALGLRAGTAVVVVGSPTHYGSQTVLVAGSIEADGKSAKLRDDQGHVTWAKK